MKKSDLKQGMLVQTTHNRYGFVELDRNRIDFCYDPDVLKDEYANLEKISLDNVFSLKFILFILFICISITSGDLLSVLHTLHSTISLCNT